MDKRVQKLWLMGGGIVVALLFISFLWPRPTLTLHADQNLTDIEINGVNQPFSQDMKVAYTKKLVVKATLDGYEAFSRTLDPNTDHIQKLTISLKKVTSDPSAATTTDEKSAREHLKEAARNTKDPTLFSEAIAETAQIISNQTFISVDGTYIFYKLQQTLTEGTTDNSMLLIDNSSGAYLVTMGPGTDFGDVGDLPVLPEQVVAYLKEIGAVHEDE